MEKKPWESKTLWVAFVTAVVAFFPGAQKIVSEHPDLIVSALAAIFTVLRFVTKDKIVIS